MDQYLPYFFFLSAAAFLLTMAYAGVSDIRRFEIPNWTSIVIALAFLPAALSRDWSLVTILTHFGVGAAMLVVGIVLVAYGIFGGGDAKLLGAAAVWTGWDGLVIYLLAVAITGGVLALGLMLFRRVKLPAAMTSVAWINRLHSEEKGIPYGVAIAVMAIYLFPELSVATPSG